VGPGDGDNLKGVYFACKFGIPHLIAAGGGSIINIGSVSALRGFTMPQDAYTASKGALISLTKSLAVQYARHGIRANIIHPGIVETPMQAPYLADPGKRASFEVRHPLVV
jgi:NAD(P)-dependent dehydrogenase (short-subunit alcohol dehydrogenase family)